MRKLAAIVRRDFLIAASYRTSMAFSVVSLLTVVVPLYFIAQAVQPLAGPAIASEGESYFAFVILGMVAFQFASTGVTAIPAALASSLRTGTFEALLGTPTRLSTLLAGFTAYPFLWTVLRIVALIGVGQILGAGFQLERLPLAILVCVLIAVAYVPFGLLGGALLVLTRTTGPLPTAVLMASMFLGGVYYPTHVIPSWLASVSGVVPLTYGLRALRQLLSTDVSPAAVAADLGYLGMLTVVFLALNAIVLHLALGHARRAGTLAQY